MIQTTEIQDLKFKHGTGMQQLWPAGKTLANRLIYERFSPGVVLDLGTGCGVIAITLASLGWEGVRAIDKDANVLDKYARNNATVNSVNPLIVCQDWADHVSAQKYSWIFGADILYDPDNHESLVTCIARNLYHEGKAIFVDPRRAEALHFSARCKERGMQVKAIHTREFMTFEVTF